MYKFFVFKKFYKYKNGKVSNLPAVSNQPRLPLLVQAIIEILKRFSFLESLEFSVLTLGRGT